MNVSEKRVLNHRIIANRNRLTRGEHTTLHQHNKPVTMPRNESDVMLDDDNGDAFTPQFNKLV